MDHGAILRRYEFLVGLLHDNPRGLTFAEIADEWQRKNEENPPYSLATFKRDKDAIKENLKVEIYYKGGVYRQRLVHEKASRQQKIADWVLESFMLGSQLNRYQSLEDRILLGEAPSGGDKLEDVLWSMEKGRKMRISQRNRITKEYTEDNVEPYCLKIYHNRWYVLCKHYSGEFRIHELERIKVEKLDVPYVMDPNFDAEEFFSEYFGVMLQKEEEKPVTDVVIRAYRNQRFKLDSQVLHHSQERLGDGVDVFSGEEWAYTDYKLRLRPTYDFVSHLESLGRYVKVIEPAWLRDELIRVHSDAVERQRQSEE